MLKKKRLRIFKKGNCFYIFLDNKLIFMQAFINTSLCSSNNTSALFTAYMYIIKLLARYGLINSLKK